MAKVDVHAANFDHTFIYIGLNRDRHEGFVINTQHKSVDLPYSDLSHLEIVTEETYKKLSGTLGAAAVGGLLLGGVGAIAGAFVGGNKNTVTFAAEFIDGKKWWLLFPPTNSKICKRP